jgi:hypothetical protein
MRKGFENTEYRIQNIEYRIELADSSPPLADTNDKIGGCLKCTPPVMAIVI